MTKVLQNIRSKYGDDKCISDYAAYLFWSSKTKSYSGPVTDMSYRAMTGREVARELGLTDDQVLAAR